MNVFDRHRIEQHLDLGVAERWLEEGFIAYSQGKVQAPPVQTFVFAQSNGDCCIKSAYVEGSETFTVKVSTGFYDNPARGLESNDGLMLVLCARTGQPLALLADQGWLTGMRTALAGRIVARRMAPAKVEAIGILGTGTQARMQLAQLMPVTTCREVSVWGRSDAGLAAYRDYAQALGFDVRVEREPKAVAEAANLIVCTTPSREALLQREWIRPGTHITALGADTSGKQELDPRLVASADRIVVDSIRQCSQYGEVSHALQAGLMSPARLVEIGTVLAGDAIAREDEGQLTVADLTGVAVQDAQIARCAFESLRG
ncbi:MULTISPECIES: ornithine cyclodeaminase family protein [Pseudomonas]|uniref:Ornithine cyclodeaminase family protein n=1 Tax=Pseudomonas taiwanensis TaxID=470150 RepID=A0ABR6V2N6_9PSED|nr:MULTISPECIES: ornithine cyclodeaminase family protein [Pseudomonas]AGZ33291.1 ornithine cyclodeaminase [Pseudomonas sp. VLB120]AVD87353.1 ornithine cyclodeaminase family protein [Pseudomonas sp. SWI44]MBC3474721.1 ornithine cyclodeaminase family protein [Pseudomonas taiwanensis]MBC3493670.1 ornithine cyclodeaminase family protein [Pseudomonas taiwanensis]MDT8926197.1 ornithine cyclodeaminase family protein [Pseudomonas taiwanensis]